MDFIHTGTGAQWLSGRVLDSRPRGCGFEPHRRHCVVCFSKTNLSLLSTGLTLEDLSGYVEPLCSLLFEKSSGTGQVQFSKSL